MPALIGTRRTAFYNTPSTVSASYEAESEAIFAAFTTPPDNTRKGHINTCVAALKSGSVWTKLDVLQVYAAADTQAALINWKNPGTFNATLGGTTTFTTDRGYESNGSTGYVDSNFNASTAGGNYTRNSCTAFAWSLTANPSAQHWIVGSASGFAVFVVSDADNNNILRVKAQGSTDFDYSVGASGNAGLFAFNRDGANSEQSYKNGAQVATAASASVALVNTKFLSLQCAGNFSPASSLVGCMGFGGSLTSGEHDALYDALLAYMQGVGAA